MSIADDKDHNFFVAKFVAFARQYSSILRKIDAAEGALGFRTTERRILEELTTGVFSQAELRKKLHLDPAQLSRCIKNMCIKGLIYRTNPEAVTRNARYFTTLDGAVHLSRSQNAQKQAVNSALSHWTPGKRDEFIDAALALNRNRPEPSPADKEQIKKYEHGELGLLVDAFANSRMHKYYGFDHGVESFALNLFGGVAAADDGRSVILIMKAGIEIIGSVVVLIGEGQSANIPLLWVSLGWDGSGRGSELIKAAMHHAKNAECKEIFGTAFVRDDSPCIYERLGWANIDATPQKLFGKDLTVERWSVAI